MLSEWAILMLGILSGVQCMYSNTDVVELNPNNFKSQVLGSNGIYVVEFYAPWCGHCQQLEPEYKKAATALKVFICEY